mgnify:CR=1 FL=1
MKSKINLKVANYFQFNFILVGFGAVAASILSVESSLIASVILFLVGLFILTTHYRLEISINKNTFTEYLWMYGLRIGKTKEYKNIESVNIKSSTNRFTYVSKYADDLTKIGQPRNGKEHVYKAYLKLSNEESLYLGERKSLKAAEKVWIDLANKLNVPLNKNL